MDARMAAGGLSALADDGRARLGQASIIRRSTYQDAYLLRRAQGEGEARTSLDEVDPETAATPTRSSAFPLHEQKCWPASSARVAVDAVFDSVSVVTTFKEELTEVGVIFCSISEAVREHPELVRKYLGSVVPITDNFFATLNSAVFSDGSFVYIPPGVRCPMELSTYFRINAAKTGQFERTLIIADKGSYVSYLEGCTAPHARREPAARRRRRTGRARRRRDQIFDRPELVSRRRERQGRHLQLRHQARRLPGHALQDHLDAGRNRLGDHLEISSPASCAATTRSANSIRSPSPTTTSRPTPAPR